MSSKKNDNQEGQELFTIFVETLTGTTFEIKVSPQDRIRSLKYKIQKVEGIPVSHQHLLYNMKELKDASCVTDPNVALHDHATVKLVLSMRGGPISLVHQTVPFSRATLRGLVKLNRREEMVDELPPGCKMAVLVLRVGDRLNLLHVVEDLDSSDSGESSNDKDNESLNSMLEGESSKSLEENSRTMEKICDLKERMEILSLQRKSRKTNSKKKSKEKEKNSNIITKKPSSSLRLPSIQRDVKEEMFKSRSEFSQIPILPDIITHHHKSSSREPDYIHINDETSDFDACDSVRPKTCPGSLCDSYDLVDCENSLEIAAHPNFRSCISACSTKFHHEWSGRKSLLRSLNIPPPIATVTGVLNEHRQTSNSGKISSITTRVPSLENLNFDHSLLESAFKSRETLRTGDINLGKKETTKKQVTSFSSEHTAHPETTFQLWNNNTTLNSAFLNPSSSNSSFYGISENTCNISLGEPSIKNTFDCDKKRRLRCSECRKKLSLTSTFECRCGLAFCSLHRYAETHNCSFDFKKDSRKILEQANPSVVAPKLPKI